MLGTELTQKSAPDGYTLMIASASHAINPTLYRKVNYDPIRDFAPVSLAIAFPFVLAVNPAMPVRGVKELIVYAKANAKRINYASSGTGATNHLAAELFKSMAGLDLQHIPYKGGGPAMNDVIGGQVSMMFGTVLETMPQVRSGKLRGLAVSSAKRMSAAPELPTIAEGGLPGYDVTGWYAFLAPARTPSAVVQKLNAELGRILQTREMRDLLAREGSEPAVSTPEQLRAHIAAEIAQLARIVKASRAGKS